MKQNSKLHLRRHTVDENQLHLDGITPRPRVTGEFRADIGSEEDAKAFLALAIVMATRALRLHPCDVAVIAGIPTTMADEIVDGIYVDRYTLDELLTVARAVGIDASVAEWRGRVGGGRVR